eukprot:62792_1
MSEPSVSEDGENTSQSLSMSMHEQDQLHDHSHHNHPQMALAISPRDQSSDDHQDNYDSDHPMNGVNVKINLNHSPSNTSLSSLGSPGTARRTK